MSSPFRNPTYRRLFSAQIIALAGTGLSTIALSLLAFDLAGGGAGQVLGTALALKMVAYVLIAPIVGGYAHRLPRRELLIALDLGRALAIGCLPFVTEIWQIYALIFVLNSFSAGFTPTYQATLPDVLPDERDYTKALSFSRLAYDLENLLSPALAGVALLFLGFSDLFTINAAAFFLSAALVFSTNLPKTGVPERTGGVLDNLTFGLKAYLRTPRLRGVLALAFGVAMASAMVIVNSVVYVREALGGTEHDLTFVLAASGCGSMVVALILPRLLDRLRDRPLMLAGGICLTISLALGILSPGLYQLLPIWFLLGAGWSLCQTPMGRVIARSASATDRPAFYAAQFALTHACWLIAYPLAGWAGAVHGLEFTFGMLAIITLAATGLASRLWPDEDALSLEHVHEAHDHQHAHTHDEHHQHDHEGWEGPEPHVHPHHHHAVRHSHTYVIDLHHQHWPR